MQDQNKKFQEERSAAISEMGADKELQSLTNKWMIASDKYKYSYNFSWMGRPIIKYPADMIVLQEIIWETRPNVIIETGIAHGGSIIFSASMLKMIGCNNPRVYAVDIDIREHNKREILENPASDIIKMFEGDSCESNIVSEIRKDITSEDKVMIILDSCHTHDHVLKELKIYSDLVTAGNYMVLPDTFIEFFPKGYFSTDRPWDVGNNPYTAIIEYLQKNENFEIDKKYCTKALITEAPSGYLKRVK